MLTLVKFYSDTCAPCKVLAPVIEQLNDSEDDLIVTNVNISDNPGLVQQHFVRAVPTSILFKDGIEVSRKVGPGSLSEFKDWLDEFRNLQPEVLPNPSAGIPGASTIVLRSASESEDA